MIVPPDPKADPEKIAPKYILLAEDDVDDVEFLTGSLQNLDQGIIVKVINSGDKALAFFERLDDQQLPGLIIMDYNLPALNGYQILAMLAVNKRYKSIPKIIWSTSNSGFFEKECLANGAMAYFVKPADLTGYDLLAKKLIGLLNGQTR
ncbi:MAG TPA: response regulator [Puia sp.]|nr:response regulator [Puia sp.]